MAVSPTFVLSVLFIVTCSLQECVASFSPNEKLAVKRRLEFINKPAIKSFTNNNGEILDCVEIDKQLAFDHPLLKNHSIQMKPSNGFTKGTKSKDPSYLQELKLSQLLPKNMRCPEGTVMVKRVTEEDLALEQMISSSLGKGYLVSNSNSSTVSHLNDAQTPVGAQEALMVTFVQNTGVAGQINIWGVDVTPDQFSGAFITVQRKDDDLINSIQAGWIVLPWLSTANDTRLFTYWTSDGGVSTGCFNTLCPGFVQTSGTIPLGLLLNRVSTYKGQQYHIDVKLIQDDGSKDWLFFYGEEKVGYWPKEIFSSLANGGSVAGWGGHIFSPKPEPAPAMGSGHFPQEGFGRATFIMNLGLYGVKDFPGEDDLKLFMTKPKCYMAQYRGKTSKMGRTMYFGGPPNCS